MFGLSKRERFRKAFLDFLSVEVFVMPKAKLLEHYPGLRAAANADANGQFGPKEASVFAARAVIADLISKITIERREKVHLEYSSLDWEAFYVWYLNSRIERAPPPREVDTLTLLIARAQCAVRYARRTGDVDEMALQDFERDIAGALEGLNENERVMERLRSATEIVIEGLGMDPKKFRPPI
jgi:hypothetical protein